MPRQRLSVRKIREILRLRCDSRLSARQIARSCGLARSTVAEYLRRAKECGLTWPLPEGLDDIELERRLFPAIPVASDTQRPEPNWPLIHKELRRKGVTLNLLWQEYRAVYSDGYQYSWFCEHYRGWAGKVDLVMRQEHRAGEKLFVDYAGQAVGVIDRRTGEVRDAQIFVAVLGASSYAYAEATWTQTLPDWIGSHVRAFTYLGGCPEILVPDNLKSGVTHRAIMISVEAPCSVRPGACWQLSAVGWFVPEPGSATRRFRNRLPVAAAGPTDRDPATG